jgi:hypothetical protein
MVRFYKSIAWPREAMVKIRRGSVPLLCGKLIAGLHELRMKIRRGSVVAVCGLP